MIRLATIEDIPSLVPLLLLLFDIEEDFIFDAEKQQKGLALLIQDGSSAVFLAEVDEQIVGMVTGQLIISTAEGGPALHIEDLVVSPEYRNKKIARSLLRVLGKWAKKRGADRMQLLADCNNNQALSFYERCNWNRTQLICLRKYYTESLTE